MKNKLTVVLTIILALSLAASVSVFAVLNEKINNSNDQEKETVIVIENLNSESIVQEETLKYINGNGVVLTLTLEETKVIGDRQLNKYIDVNHNEYTFDAKGNLISTEIYTPIYDIVDDVTVTPEDNISKNEAKEIGEEYLKKLMGEDFDSYTFKDIFEYDLSYNVRFETRFGKDGFINGPKCSVNVYKNGIIEGHNVGDTSFYETFDYSLLDGLTKEDVIGFAEKVVDEACTSDKEIVSKKVLNCKLSYVDDKPCILVSIKVEATVDTYNDIYGNVYVNRQHPNIYSIEDYNGRSAVGVIVKYPLG